ncbi:MAG: RNase P subunit p30 family protein [Candidatus Bathyarchaeales archaeon]
MKRFYDLHLRVPLSDFDLAERMINKASKLGYSGVGVPLPMHTFNETVSKLQRLCDSVGIDFVSRADFVPKSADDLLSLLRRFRRKFEVISVLCLSKTIARQAAKDRRVDLISFTSTDVKKRFFDAAEVELAANALTSLEVDLAPVILASSFERIRLLSSLRREVALADKFSVPVVFSSGASEEFFMRTPRDFAAVGLLFDTPLPRALDALSTNPSTIIKRNRAKLNPTFVAPGIRIIRRRKDCEE